MIKQFKEDICRLNTILENSQEIVITTHARPDGDAMGSTLGLYHFLKKLLHKENVNIILNDRYPESLAFMVGDDVIVDIIAYNETPAEAQETLKKCDLMICLDFNLFSRTDSLAPLLEQTQAIKILIDHHLDPNTQAFDMVFSRPAASSTCEFLYNILKELPAIGNDIKNLPLSSANALMTGMITDTNNFSNSTHPSTLEMASELLEVGVERDVILDQIYNCYHVRRARLFGHCLLNLLKITENGVAYIVLDKKTLDNYGIQEGETEGFVNYPLTIKNVKMSILAKEDEGKIRISIRSKKGVSAKRCANLYFNGGGHENAAGGKLLIPENVTSVHNVEQYIEDHTDEFFKENN